MSLPQKSDYLKGDFSFMGEIFIEVSAISTINALLSDFSLWGNIFNSPNDIAKVTTYDALFFGCNF